MSDQHTDHRRISMPAASGLVARMSPWKFEALDGTTTLDVPELERLRVLWLDKVSAEKLPAWRDFDPRELKPWIGNLAVIDVPTEHRSEKLGDYRYRLWGTRLTELFGADLTGKLLSQADYGAHEPRMRQLFNSVVEGKVAVSSGSIYWQQRGYRRFRSLFLPVSTNGKDIDQIIGVSLEIDVSPQWAEVC